MIDVMELAIYIVKKCMEEECPVSNLQLQKILYYIQVAFLQKYGSPIFDDPIEAWKFGPVVPRVYYRYAGFGAMPIYSWDTITIVNMDTDKQKLIDEVIDSKKNLPPWALVSDTHMPGKAWSRAYNRNGSYSTIKLEDMKNYG